jgi:hypothetical protein
VHAERSISLQLACMGKFEMVSAWTRGVTCIGQRNTVSMVFPKIAARDIHSLQLLVATVDAPVQIEEFPGPPFCNPKSFRETDGSLNRRPVRLQSTTIKGRGIHWNARGFHSCY